MIHILVQYDLVISLSRMPLYNGYSCGFEVVDSRRLHHESGLSTLKFWVLFLSMFAMICMTRGFLRFGILLLDFCSVDSERCSVRSQIYVVKKLETTSDAIRPVMRVSWFSLYVPTENRPIPSRTRLNFARILSNHSLDVIGKTFASLLRLRKQMSEYNEDFSNASALG